MSDPKTHAWSPQAGKNYPACKRSGCGRPPEEHITAPWPRGPCRHCGGEIIPDPLHPGRPWYVCTGCAPGYAPGYAPPPRGMP